MKCLNCNKRGVAPGMPICSECLGVGNANEKALKEGIVVTYRDGSKELFKQDKTVKEATQ